LIRVTSFFRDPAAFEAVKKKILPYLFKNQPHDRPLRVWVPGCSTGEEAYSLAIMLREYLLQVKRDFRTQIFATDIDSNAIDSARAAVYSDSITVDVSPERIVRFFVKKGNTYKIKKDIREMVVFAVQNVIKDPPFSRLDMISCRNLLIYMNAALQKKALPLFSFALNPDGILFLGSSETIGDHAHLFTVLDKRWKLFKVKKTAHALMPAKQRPSTHLEWDVKTDHPLEVATLRTIGVGELIEKILLERYTPASVIVNEKGDILYFHGKTGSYLEPSAGKASLNIAEMAREGLRVELRAALRRAVAQKKDMTLKGLRIRTNGSFLALDVEVRYIKKPENLEGLLMVVFHETTPLKAGRAALKSVLAVKPTKRVSELEDELKVTKEHLQTTIEELETSNEELKSANEELQSSNEELQSTNEELETSKEELQSVNEELVTVNAELQDKIDELTQTNSDMSNLMAGTQIATVFLNNDLRIKRFTPTATQVISLIETDVGRSLGDIASKLNYPELVSDAAEVLRTLASREQMARGIDGRWFLVRILPYRTLDNVIDGVVVTFVDITEQKKTEESLAVALEYARGISETARGPLVVLGPDLKVISANKPFYATFKVSSEDTVNKRIYDLGNRQWDIPRLRELFEKILPENNELVDYVVEHDFPNIGIKKMLLNARRITGQDGKSRMILLAIEDITDRR
jgi:two-component system CheB/CheR fusion protein